MQMIDFLLQALKLVQDNNCSTPEVVKCQLILASIKSKAGNTGEGLVLICKALKLAEGISGDASDEVLCEVLEGKAEVNDRTILAFFS